MALPKIVLRGRKVILLSGFKDAPEDKRSKHRVLWSSMPRTSCGSPPSGIQMRSPSAISPANGSRRPEPWPPLTERR